ncbi:MOSC domain-containing protein [Paenibacillus massiliensis]|uniref:MOSC domain-containing protein n=1 Tax=Paenibacillus massiliensis TaxID=225917 RepID=UPI00056CA8A4|nr:MOSC domain-containing protein [Paenibacillus massiliensis]
MHVTELDAKVMSVNVSMPSPLQYGGKQILSGIHKKPVQHSVMLTRTGVAGDGQADLINHGGPDKAVCIYDIDRYPLFEQEMGRQLTFGAFGENLSLQGALEDDVYIGDIFRIGQAVVQVSQPRQPCFKLAARYDWKELPLRFQSTGYTGYYFRVLEEGEVAQGDSLQLLERPQHPFTVMRANRVKYLEKNDLEQARALMELDALSSSWKDSLYKRVAGEGER